METEYLEIKRVSKNPKNYLLYFKEKDFYYKVTLINQDILKWEYIYNNKTEDDFTYFTTKKENLKKLSLAPCLECFSKEKCDKLIFEKTYLNQWKGKYSFGFGGVHMGEEFEGGATIEVKEGDKKSSINLYWETKNIETGNTIDKGDTTSQLEIVRVLKDTLELQGEKDKQYILYKTQFIVDDKKKNGYAIRGSSVYMLSPPNNDYPLTKSKTYVFYTNVDNLRVRAKPELKGGSLELLPINKEITYLGEKSKNQTTVTLNGENITDYWYKVKTPKGNIGWVHGCCVSFK